MHVIAMPLQIDFSPNRPDAKYPMQAWFRLMTRQTFADFNELRVTFPTADYVAGVTVFNMGGNKYRLIAAIDYNRHKVFIRTVLTHPEYDQGHWKRRES